MNTKKKTLFSKIRKHQFNYHLFCFLYCTLTYIVFNSFNVGKFTRWFYNKEQFDLVGMAVFYLMGWGLYLIFFLLAAHRRSLKFLSVVLLILSTVVLYFLTKYDAAIDRTMIMNAFNTDPKEVKSLLSLQMIPYILFLALLPAAAVSNLNIHFPKRYFLKSLKIISVILLAGFIGGYFKYNAIHRAANLSEKYVIYNLIPINYIRGLGSVVIYRMKPYFSNRVKNVEVTGSVTKKDDLVVVLAVGESARQKSFSLYGYGRETNPLLSKVSGLHVLNGKARLGSTLYALPEILVKHDVPLSSITHKLGIETACYVNFSLYDNCVIPGEIKAVDCKYGKDSCFDEDVIPMLEKNLKSYKSGYRFLLLHLGGGSHGPSYYQRIPSDRQKFQPICKDADVINKCTTEELFNTYDNTILYTDSVVNSAISTLEESKVPYVFIYLSDHGESLLEEGRIFHGMPPGVKLPPEQAQIPLLVKSSMPINIKPQAEYTQPEVFDTVLDLFSIDTPAGNRGNSFIKIRK